MSHPMGVPVYDELTMDLWFRYHAPNKETLPVILKINDGIEQCYARVAVAIASVNPGADASPVFGEIGQAVLSMAKLVNESSPQSEDKADAIRNLRVVRMVANDAVIARLRGDHIRSERFEAILFESLMKAKYSAISSVVIGDRVSRMSTGSSAGFEHKNVG